MTAASNPCAYCGGVGFYHLDGCPLVRRESIQDTCDSLAEDGVPPDVLEPIRAHANSLLSRAPHSQKEPTG